MISEYKLNDLLRQIVKESFEGSQVKCAQKLKITKQDLNNFYRNRKKLGFGRFRKWADKAGFTIKISVQKNKIDNNEI